jgi:phosphatidate cytidylyltransferase
VAIITGVLIAALVLVTFDIGTLLAMALVVVVVTLATAEVYAAFRRAGEHPATLLGLVATVSLLIATYNRGTQALGLVTVLLFAFVIVWFMVGVEKTDTLRGISSTILVYVWIGVFGSYAALLLNPNLFPNRHGLAFLLGAILVSVAYDVAALFIGSSLGRRPMAPEISPNKTWEGLAGGTVGAILMAVIVVHLIHPWTLSAAFALGIVVSIVSPIGDLAESLIKRNLGLKDMGRLLPGHGGMLDRVDGLLFVLPATYYLVQAFHLS